MNEPDGKDQLLNASFSLEDFVEAFRAEIHLRSVPAPSGRKVRGKSSLFKLELSLEPDGRLTSATMVFPFFLKDEESNRNITAQVARFLELCLPDRVLPEEWMQEATQALKASDEKLFESEYDGLVISLFQMKDDLIFMLQAERKGAPKSASSR